MALGDSVKAASAGRPFACAGVAGALILTAPPAPALARDPAPAAAPAPGLAAYALTVRPHTTVAEDVTLVIRAASPDPRTAPRWGGYPEFCTPMEGGAALRCALGDLDRPMRIRIAVQVPPTAQAPDLTVITHAPGRPDRTLTVRLRPLAPDALPKEPKTLVVGRDGAEPEKGSQAKGKGTSRPTAKGEGKKRTGSKAGARGETGGKGKTRRSPVPGAAARPDRRTEPAVKPGPVTSSRPGPMSSAAPGRIPAGSTASPGVVPRSGGETATPPDTGDDQTAQRQRTPGSSPNPPDPAPGNVGGTGRPETAPGIVPGTPGGPAGESGRPGPVSRPDTAGKPSKPGKPSKAGKSGNTSKPGKKSKPTKTSKPSESGAVGRPGPGRASRPDAGSGPDQAMRPDAAGEPGQVGGPGKGGKGKPRVKEARPGQAERSLLPPSGGQVPRPAEPISPPSAVGGVPPQIPATPVRPEAPAEQPRKAEPGVGGGTRPGGHEAAAGGRRSASAPEQGMVEAPSLPAPPREQAAPEPPGRAPGEVPLPPISSHLPAPSVAPSRAVPPVQDRPPVIDQGRVALTTPAEEEGTPWPVVLGIVLAVEAALLWIAAYLGLWRRRVIARQK